MTECGTFLKAVVIELAQQARADEAVSADNKNQLVDLTDAALAPISVVAPRDLEYGLSRIWQVFFEENGWETMVLCSLTEAERWLQQRLTEACGDDICRLKLNETSCETDPATDCNRPECQA